MPDIVFHAGYGKTATTYLQQQILPAVQALGSYSTVSGTKALHRTIRKRIRTNDPRFWKSRKGHDIADRIVASVSRTPIVYSSEHLMAPPELRFSIRRLGERHALVQHIEAFATHAWNGRGTVHVMLTLRNQADWLASFYAQKSQRLPASQFDFEKRVRSFLKRPGVTGRAYLDYVGLVGQIERRLGEGRVHVLVYEEMMRKQFWRDLGAVTDYNFVVPSGYAGAPRNASRTGLSCWRAGRSGNEVDITLTPALRREIMSVYEESNAALQTWLGRNLAYYNVT